MRWFTWVAFACACAYACASAGDDPATLRVDLDRLHALIADDRATALMIDAERAVSQRKPVHAAELIAKGVLPQLDVHLARLRDLELGSVEARKLRLRLVDAYESRRAALEGYRATLARGTLDSLDVVEALRQQRDAESSLIALEGELQARRRPTE